MGKLIGIAAAFVLVLLLVKTTEQAVKNAAGVSSYSPFGGWQLANNALNIMQTHEKIDYKKIGDSNTADVVKYIDDYFDTARERFGKGRITTAYLWDKESPLNRYKSEFAQKNHLPDFKAWCALGPVYNDFGMKVIMQKPGRYITHFVIPNSKSYFFPSLEALGKYNRDSDFIDEPAIAFYNYKTNKTRGNNKWVYILFMKPWGLGFFVLNITFIAGSIVYYFGGRYKTEPKIFNKFLLVFLSFFLANFFFIIFLAPSVFRYHVFIVTLIFPFIIYLFQQSIKPVKEQTRFGIDPV